MSWLALLATWGALALARDAARAIAALRNWNASFEGASGRYRHWESDHAERAAIKER